MSLITCPDCQSQISDAALTCIKCGRPMQIKAAQSNVVVTEGFIPPRSLSFVEAIDTCFRKYAVFSGRASRSELWYFFLFGIIMGVLTDLIDSMMGYIVFGPSSAISILVFFIPNLAVATRRLHDTNRSGWRQLWFLTIIGAFFIWFWCAQKGDQQTNSHD